MKLCNKPISKRYYCIGVPLKSVEHVKVHERCYKSDVLATNITDANKRVAANQYEDLSTPEPSSWKIKLDFNSDGNCLRETGDKYQT